MFYNLTVKIKFECLQNLTVIDDVVSVEVINEKSSMQRVCLIS